MISRVTHFLSHVFGLEGRAVHVTVSILTYDVLLFDSHVSPCGFPPRSLVYALSWGRGFTRIIVCSLNFGSLIEISRAAGRVDFPS